MRYNASQKEVVPLASDEIDDCDDERDDLDEVIAEITQQNPHFPTLLEQAKQERLAAIARGEDPNDMPWDNAVG